MVKLDTCRACKGKDLKLFLSLGDIPLVNSFLKESQLGEDEPRFPLDVYFCGGCEMVQLGDVVPPEMMFKDYVYVSGTSETMRVHFEEFAKEAVVRLGKGLAIDIGGNDGTFLKEFRKLGMRVLNVDPASNIAAMAREQGVDTINNFWGKGVVAEILKNFGKARVITGTNVFAHVNDLDEFIGAAAEVLEDDGALVVEFPYLVDMIEETEFDTIYHEHLSYIAVRPMVKLFGRLGMEVVDAVRTPVHGGSIRIYAMKKGRGKISPAISSLVSMEKEMGLDRFDTYKNFGVRVGKIKDNLLSILTNLKSQGKKIIGYGAPAKGNVLMNYAGIGPQFLDYLIDRNPLKQGLLSPGTHLPIYSTDKIKQDRPDYMLVLAWNFADEVMRQQADFRESGGKFIIPIPEPKIV